MRRLKSLLMLLSCLFVVANSANAVNKVTNEQLGTLVKTSDLLVLNFWATWCAPCIEELPVLAKVHKQFSNARLVGISMDELDRGDLVDKFVKDHRMKYEVALWAGANFEKMVNSIDPKWNGPIPATFIFKKGKLVFSKTGQVTEREMMKALQPFAGK